ncbi:FAD-binding oxidoreductase [Algoriphagus formosus]|uniref:2Fe-2S iron-sulfur cluster binding domain-containing protein n=1 Tax=Algoriphagus formosus TaxID=2007308 RepID=A0A4R5USI2_9BACT|nr:FAD-binding oxidoreductase [Algoriphagus aquimaris]TDK42033.1 2Fe-2S iron-sulfur cluster binding domain-containing protein [Algoriphagus aquimaris]
MGFEIKLKDGQTFSCESTQTLIEGAVQNGVFLDHSCLTGRCSSCKFKVIKGETVTGSEELPLSLEEKNQGYILGCVRKPVSDIELEAEDLSQYGFSNPVTTPAKINTIKSLSTEIIQVNLRVPPNQKVNFLEGQYLNVLWNGIKRSYSIASPTNSSEIELIIKKYEGGAMSAYWFGQAKPNDLLRLEIPKGTFFLRNHSDKDTLVFLATGTGIAPIKSILESQSNQDKLALFKRVIVLWGMKYEKEIFWKPESAKIEFIPVLSRESQPKQYVQDVIGNLDLDISKSVIYACGSDQMIQEAKKNTLELGLNSNHFYSDAFVASN